MRCQPNSTLFRFIFSQPNTSKFNSIRIANATWIYRKKNTLSLNTIFADVCLYIVEFVFEITFLPSLPFLVCVHVHFDFNRSVFSAAEMYLLVLSWLFFHSLIAITHILQFETAMALTAGKTRTGSIASMCVCVIKNANSTVRFYWILNTRF